MSTPKSTRAGRPSTCAPRGVVATPGHGDAVAEGVKKVVLTFAVFGADAKALDLGCACCSCCGSVKANKYRRFSASNPAERGGNSSAKTAQL
jgi:hypothetical protein